MSFTPSNKVAPLTYISRMIAFYLFATAEGSGLEINWQVKKMVHVSNEQKTHLQVGPVELGHLHIAQRHICE